MIKSTPNAISPKRALSLDALRGFAVLTMVLSGIVPYRTLPAWMYHAQLPPPDRVFNPNLPGLTWVDLVFPFFLFALGAAIPLALMKRIKTESTGKTVLHIIERTLLLAFFAIFLQHIRPHVIWPQIFSNPTFFAWLSGLMGFVILFGIYLRPPKSWQKQYVMGTKSLAWLGAVLFIVFIKYPDGSRFSLYRSDIIIIVLTNAYFFGSLIWLATRKKRLIRLGILGFLIAIRLAAISTGWVKVIWDFSPIPWLYSLYYLQYLFIVIPGTVIGDMLLDWTEKSKSIDMNQYRWSQNRMLLIMLLMLVIVIIQLVGLQSRWVWQTVIVSTVFLGLGCYLFSKPATESEIFLRNLFYWGMYWLILGLIFEPYEGGVKKDHPTMSYYFVTTGLAIIVLIAFTIIIEYFKKQNSVQLLINNGQNPMIAYVGMMNLLIPLLSIFGINRLIENITRNPWLGFLKALLYTWLLAIIVAQFTKRKLFWKT